LSIFGPRKSRQNGLTDIFSIQRPRKWGRRISR